MPWSCFVYAEKLDEKPELLITADCVHGESNTADFGAENYAAADHHASVYAKSPMYDIRPSYGSCSSVIAVLLNEAGMISTQMKSLLQPCITGFIPIRTK